MNVKKKFNVVDTDAHFFESFDHLVPYMEDPWRTRLSNGGDPSRRWFFPSTTGDRFRYGKIQREEVKSPVTSPVEEMGPEDVPKMLDHLGLDDIIVLSSQMLRYPSINGGNDRPKAYANACVDYMLDKVVDPSEGIYTVIPIPYHDPEAAVDLVDRVADERGIVAACFVTEGPEPPLGNHVYDPIYEAIQNHGLPIIFHTGGSGLDQYHRQGYEKFIETHTLGFLEGNMSQLTSLIVQGFPEKFPDIDVIFQESGIFWVTTMMHRLDEEYLKRSEEAPLLEKRPSEYMKEMYFGTQPMEISGDQEYLKRTIDVIGGADRLIYASDYPHWDYDRPTSVTDRSFLSDEEKQKILGGNAREVFGL